MKKIILPFFLLFLSAGIKAQMTPTKTAEKFLELFNEGKYDFADSTMGAPDFRKTMPLSTPEQYQRLLNQYGRFQKIISTNTDSKETYTEVKMYTSYDNADLGFRFVVGKEDGLIYYFALYKVERK